MAEIIYTVCDWLQANLTDYNATSRATRGGTLAKNWVLLRNAAHDLLSANKLYFPIIMLQLIDETAGDQVGMGYNKTVDTTVILATVLVPRDLDPSDSTLMGMELCRKIARDIRDTLRANWKTGISITSIIRARVTGMKERPVEWDPGLVAFDLTVEVVSEGAGD